MDSVMHIKQHFAINFKEYSIECNFLIPQLLLVSWVTHFHFADNNFYNF